MIGNSVLKPSKSWSDFIFYVKLQTLSPLTEAPEDPLNAWKFSLLSEELYEILSKLVDNN